MAQHLEPNSGITLDIRRDYWRMGGWRALLYEKRLESIYIASPPEFQIVTPEAECREQQSTFFLGEDTVQGIMDALWQEGVRPSRGVSSTGQLEAANKHLEDMRRLVAHYSKAKLP